MVVPNQAASEQGNKAPPNPVLPFQNLLVLTSRTQIFLMGLKLQASVDVIALEGRRVRHAF